MSSQTRSRQLGIFQSTSLVTGNLVGSGVFLLPAALAAFGNLTLLAWVVTGIGALMLGWIFSKMSVLNPQNGGPHQFVTSAFGKPYGFWVAWGYWVLSWISNAALIVAAVSYLNAMMPGLTTVQIFGLQVFILFSVTLINILGIRTAGKFELVMTCLKLIPLVGIPIIGVFYIDWSAVSFSLPQDIGLFSGLKEAMFLTIWAFVGIETATVTGGEIKNPSKTIPFATIFGTSLALIVYLFGCFTMLNLLGQTALVNSNAPYADLAGILFGGNWTRFIALTAILCCLGSFNGWTMVVGRIAQGASDQGLFPKIFARTNAHGTPVMSLLISATCTLPLLFLSLQKDLLSQFNFIIDVSITLILIVYAISIIAYIKLFNQSFSVGKILITAGALLFVLVSLWAAGLKMIALSLTLLVMGLPMFLVRKQSLGLMPTPHIESTAN